MTKYTSFDNPKPEIEQDRLYGVMALDSWSKKPRLWLSNATSFPFSSGFQTDGHSNLTIWEERAQ